MLRLSAVLGSALVLATAPAYARSTTDLRIHTTEFAGGAVRDQLATVVPEPEPVQLIGLGAVALGMIRRRKSKQR